MKQHIEYLSKDILEKQFIRSFQPMYQFQQLIASSRVNLKDSFVTSPSLIQKGHTIFNVIGILALDFVTFQYYSLLNKVDNSTYYYLSLCIIILHTLTFLCNVIHLRFINGNENAKCYVKLQQIDRCMKLDKNKTISAIMYNNNTFSITWVLILFCTIFGVASTKHSFSLGSLLVIISTQTTTVIEIVACSNTFMFFHVRTQFLNGILYNYIHYMNKKNLLPTKKTVLFSLFPTKKFMRQLAAETHDFVSSDTDIYLKEVLHGFSMNQQICKFQIFLFCCKLVAACLLAFQFVLLAARNDNVDLKDSLTPVVFTVIDLLVALILVTRCELFLREVKETKHLAITIMSIHFEGRLRGKAKRMLKLIEEIPPSFSVYDMWVLNANLLLQIFTLVTTLILTQLQFVVFDKL